MLFVDKHAVRPPALLSEKVREQKSTRVLQGVSAVNDSQVLWDRLDGDTRRAVLIRLLQDQGFLCAYCERRIHVPDSASKGIPAHVEHYVPRHPSYQEYRHDDRLSWTDTGELDASGAPIMRAVRADELSVDYRNLFAVCSNEQSNESVREQGGNGTMLTCDKQRGNHPLHVDPRSRQSLLQLHHKTNGCISSDDADIRQEIGIDGQHPGMLNLNAAHLRAARKKVVNTLLKNVMAGDSEALRNKRCRQQIQHLLNQQHSRGVKDPFYETQLYILLRKRPSMRREFGDVYPA